MPNVPETPEGAAPATIGSGVYVSESRLVGADRGLFVRRAFAKGTLLTEYYGNEFFDKFAAAKCSPQTHIIHMSVASSGQLGNDVYIDGDREPLEGRGGGSFANHKNKGDCNANFVLLDRRVYLEAVCDIDRDQEVYVNYGTDLDIAMGLKCRVVTLDIDSRPVVETRRIDGEVWIVNCGM